MIYEVDVHKMDLNINKGSVVIERVQGANAGLSFDDKFKPYVTISEKNGSLKIKVYDNFRESIKFRLNLADSPKCSVRIQSGLIEATAVCKNAKYSVDSGNMHINIANSLLGTADMHVSTGALNVNNGGYTAYGVSNNYRYQGALPGQRSNFVVTTGNMECNFK
jgi:hypothetical protein